jgi:hypothetical protein
VVSEGSALNNQPTLGACCFLVQLRALNVGAVSNQRAFNASVNRVVLFIPFQLRRFLSGVYPGMYMPEPIQSACAIPTLPF